MYPYDLYYLKEPYQDPAALQGIYHTDYYPIKSDEFLMTEEPFRPPAPYPQQGGYGPINPPPTQMPHEVMHSPHGGVYNPPPSHGGMHAPPYDGTHPSHHGGPPIAPPPSFVPHMTTFSGAAIHAHSMRSCLYKNTYVWLMNGRGFWFYPTYIGSNIVVGYRWRASRHQWSHFGIEAREIRSFQCF